jgi:hypothetical protein
LNCIDKNTQVFNLPTVISKTRTTSNSYLRSLSHSTNPLLLPPS